MLTSCSCQECLGAVISHPNLGARTTEAGEHSKLLMYRSHTGTLLWLAAEGEEDIT